MGSRLAKVLSLVVPGFLPLLAHADTCRDDSLWLRGDWGQARFSVEIADDTEERARGLMFRDHLPSGAGMLFVYPRESQVSFWMKNTLIPLDMIFANRRGIVLRVHENAEPGDLTPVDGGSAVQFVLEINGGLARRLGIAAGSEMRHPSIDAAFAAWPCDR